MSEAIESEEEHLCSEEEQSIEEPSIMDCTIDESQPVINFEIIEDSSKRGKSKLTDSRGYTYNVKRKHVNSTDWQCTIRPKVNTNELLQLMLNLGSYMVLLNCKVSCLAVKFISG